MLHQDTRNIVDMAVSTIQNPRVAAIVAKDWYETRTKQIDQSALVDTICRITGENHRTVHRRYREAVELVAPGVYNEQLSKYAPVWTPSGLHRTVVGPHKVARADRIALYVLVRVLDPDLVVETGVNWGESALFITEALRRNGHGELLSFDLGIDAARESYNLPADAEEVGFLVPEHLSEYWELVLGDSVEQMADRLPDERDVELFYHDSLHTYDHMMAEFETVLSFMAGGGVLMSEDIDENDAWTDFLDQHQEQVAGDYRYYSMQGIDEETREVGATMIR